MGGGTYCRKKLRRGGGDGEREIQLEGQNKTKCNARNRGFKNYRQNGNNRKKGGRKRNRHRNSYRELRVAFMNIDGLNIQKKEDIEKWVKVEKVDVMAVLEIKRSQDQKANGIKGYRWQTFLRDKPTGGIGVWIKEGLNIQIEEDSRKSLGDLQNEMIWLRIGNGRKIWYLGIIYMGVNKAKYKEKNNNLWDEIERCCADYKDKGKVVIMGDLNSHISEKGEGINENGKRLEKLVKEQGLEIANFMENCKGKWTYVEKMKRGAKTVIDYICISEEHKNDITSMWIDEGRESGIESDHSLVYCKIRNDNLKRGQKLPGPSSFTKSAPKWKLGTNAEWEAYNQELMNTIIQVANTHMVWDQKNLDEFYEEGVRRVTKAWEDKVGKIEQVSKRGNTRKRRKGWWSEELGLLYKKKKEANKNWRKAIIGRETEGEEQVERCWVLLKEIKEIWKTRIREQKKIFNSNIFEEITKSKNSTRELWDHINKSKREEFGEQRGGVKLKKDGELIDNKDKTLAHIEAVWEQDFSTENGIIQEQNQIKESINGKKEHNIVYEISSSEVEDSIKKLKEGKAGGKDNISNEMLTKGGNTIILWLRNLFGVCTNYLENRCGDSFTQRRGQK